MSLISHLKHNMLLCRQVFPGTWKALVLITKLRLRSIKVPTQWSSNISQQPNANTRETNSETCKLAAVMW